MALIAILSLFLLVITLITIQLGLAGYGDVEHFSRYYGIISGGQLPYTGLQVEYPPGGVFLLVLAGWVGHLFHYYETGFVVLAIVALASVLYHVLIRFGRKTLIITCLALLPLLMFVFFELDIFAAVALYFSLWQFQQKRFGWSAILLAIATLIKASPGVAVLGLFWLVPKDKRVTYATAFIASLSVIFLPLALVVPHGLWYSFTYHSGRPIEMLSGAALVGYAGHALGWPAQLFSSHYSRNIDFPHAKLVANLATLCLGAGLAGVSWLTWRGRWRHKPVTLSMLLLVVFILLFKVGSPQYMLVPVMLLPLAIEEFTPIHYGKLLLGLFTASTVVWLQFIILFYKSDSFNAGHDAWGFVAFSLAKVLALTYLIVLLFRQTPPNKIQKSSSRNKKRQAARV